MAEDEEDATEGGINRGDDGAEEFEVEEIQPGLEMVYFIIYTRLCYCLVLMLSTC